MAKVVFDQVIRRYSVHSGQLLWEGDSRRSAVNKTLAVFLAGFLVDCQIPAELINFSRISGVFSEADLYHLWNPWLLLFICNAGSAFVAGFFDLEGNG